MRSAHEIGPLPPQPDGARQGFALNELAPGTALAVLRKLPAPRNRGDESDGCRSCSDQVSCFLCAAIGAVEVAAVDLLADVHHDPGQNAFLAAATTQLASARLGPGGFAPTTSSSTPISDLPAANSRQAI